MRAFILCISNKQVNRLGLTFLWRRVAESALHGTYFGNIPEEVIADLHRISEAFAAPLANLFALLGKDTTCVPSYLKSSQRSCKPPFLAVRPFCVCLKMLFPQQPTKAPKCKRSKAALSKQEESGGKDVDALTFMQTVIMSFARGMEYGDQTPPINDLFVSSQFRLCLP